MAYMQVIQNPVQPPASLLCKMVQLGCPKPVAQNPDALAALYAPLATSRGLGCAGGKCSCGGACKQGMGLFDSGMNVSGWGVPEWGAVGLGAFALFRLVSPTVKARRKEARFQKVKKRLDF
jgi:hypothetical protein